MGEVLLFITICVPHYSRYAAPGGHAAYGVVLRPLASWDCGFESRQVHGLFLVSVVFCAGRDLCDGPIPRPWESYRLGVNVCDQMQQ